MSSWLRIGGISGAISRRPRSWACGAVAALALLFADAARGSFEFTRPRWDATTEILATARAKLGAHRVVLGAQLDWSLLTPKDGVLILHPETHLEFNEVSAFLTAGGRLAIADDFGKADQLLSRFQIHRAPAPSDPLERLAGNPKLQLARPARSEGKEGDLLTHPITQGIDHVVTNHPTSLTTSEQVELTPVLEIADSKGAAHLLAVIGVIGDATGCGLEDGTPKNARARCGRLLAIADGSVFIDLMQQFEGNRALAAGVIDYLLEDDAWGRRGGDLYILANDFAQVNHYGGNNDLERQLDALADALSGWLSDARQNGLPTRFAWALSVLACGAVALGALRLSGKVYQRPNPRYVAAQELVAQGGAMGRAAVLSAPTTQSALVVLELKHAIEDYLRERLGLSPRAAGAEILETLEARAVVDLALLRALRQTFAQLGDAERALLHSENIRFSAQAIGDIQTQLIRTQEQVEAHSRRMH